MVLLDPMHASKRQAFGACRNLLRRNCTYWIAASPTVNVGEAARDLIGETVVHPITRADRTNEYYCLREVNVEYSEQ